MSSVIIDCGSVVTKCGFSGEDKPKIFPSCVGRTKHPGILVGMDMKDCYVGYEVIEKRGMMSQKFPVENGMVTNWNDMEKLWGHIFKECLEIKPEEHPIFMTEAALNPLNNREKMTSIMFETFCAPSIYIGHQQVLSLISSGRKTGIVLESGGGVTHSVQIYEGDAVPHTTCRRNIGGKDISNYLVKILGEGGIEMTTSSERDIVNAIKEKFCYVSVSDYKSELLSKSSEKREYQLADGSKLQIGTERFKAPEILFDPTINSKENKYTTRSHSLYYNRGYNYNRRREEEAEDEEYERKMNQSVQDMVVQTIERCYDQEVKAEMFKNITLGGGNTLFGGFGERLRDEVLKITRMSSSKQKNTRVKVDSPVDRIYSAWIGGSILSTTSSFSKKWITKDEYDDHGATIVHRKCI